MESPRPNLSADGVVLGDVDDQKILHLVLRRDAVQKLQRRRPVASEKRIEGRLVTFQVPSLSVVVRPRAPPRSGGRLHSAGGTPASQ